MDSAGRRYEKEVYIKRFIAFSDRTEKAIRASLAVLAVLVLIAQALLAQPDIRPHMTTVDRFEGIPFE